MVMVARRQPDPLVEAQQQYLPFLSRVVGLLAFIAQVHPRVLHLIGHEKPVGVVDKAAIPVLQHLLGLLRVGGGSAHPGLPGAVVHVEQDDECLAFLVGSLEAVAAGEAIPCMAVAGQRLAIFLNVEAKAQKARLIPAGVSPQRLPDLTGYLLCLKFGCGWCTGGWGSRRGSSLSGSALRSHRSNCRHDCETEQGTPETSSDRHRPPRLEDMASPGPEDGKPRL